jgi:hypothetical protein
MTGRCADRSCCCTAPTRRWSLDGVFGPEDRAAKERGALVRISGELLRVLYWFNPLVWIVCRRLRQESEQACDDVVLAVGIDGTDYATHLVELARSFRQHRPGMLPALAMACPSHLERRVRAMLNPRLNRSPLTAATRLAILVGVASIAVPIAGLNAAGQTSSATFSGSLVDAIGRVLPNTTLILVNRAAHEQREAVSDQTGRFVFGGLSGGAYELQVRTPRFRRRRASQCP